MNKIGVFVGRLSPLHIGHEKIIDKMIEYCGLENCIVFIGSSASPLSWRVLFSYNDRERWLRRLYGKDIRIVGMPDVLLSDTQWLEMLDDYINAIFPEEKDVVFYGGCSEDVRFFYEHGRRKVNIVNREELPVSATQVREMLLQGMDISGVVNPKIAKEVKEVFHKQLKKLDELRG